MLPFVACFLAVLLVTVTGVAIAQSSSDERELSERDRTAVRQLYRVHPDLADELEKALRSASTDAARRENLIEFQEKLTEMKRQGEKVPKAYRLPDWDTVVWFSEMSFAHVWYDKDTITFSSAHFEIEDDIISKLRFADYEELYDFFRDTGKKVFGFQMIKELDALRKEDPLKYTEALHGLLDELKAYRASKGKARVVRIRPGDEVKVEDRAVGAEKTRKAENRSVRRPAQPVRP
jgi:hypothetical protein